MGALREAVERGELSTELDPDQLAFELLSLATGGVMRFQLSKDPQVMARTRHAVATRLFAARPPGRKPRKPASRRLPDAKRPHTSRSAK
jgi:hypothetical protein